MTESSKGKGKPRQLRLYCLRKYFRNNIKVESAYREFWMCHSFGVDEHYLSRDVEKHREKYAEGYESLRVFEATPTVKVNQEQKQEIEGLKERITSLEKDLQHYLMIVLKEEKKKD
jgi:hypothetical protein